MKINLMLTLSIIVCLSSHYAVATNCGKDVRCTNSNEGCCGSQDEWNTNKGTCRNISDCDQKKWLFVLTPPPCPKTCWSNDDCCSNNKCVNSTCIPS